MVETFVHRPSDTKRRKFRDKIGAIPGRLRFNCRPCTERTEKSEKSRPSFKKPGFLPISQGRRRARPGLATVVADGGLLYFRLHLRRVLFAVTGKCMHKRETFARKKCDEDRPIKLRIARTIWGNSRRRNMGTRSLPRQLSRTGSTIKFRERADAAGRLQHDRISSTWPAPG